MIENIEKDNLLVNKANYEINKARYRLALNNEIAKTLFPIIAIGIAWLVLRGTFDAPYYNVVNTFDDRPALTVNDYNRLHQEKDENGIVFSKQYKGQQFYSMAVIKALPSADDYLFRIHADINNNSGDTIDINCENKSGKESSDMLVNLKKGQTIRIFGHFETVSNGFLWSKNVDLKDCKFE